MIKMNVIVYKTKHGATRKIAKVLSQYLSDCILMNINDIDYPTLQRAQMIIVGTPVYYGKLDEDIVHFINNHQELLISKHYCLYVTGILQSEFMTFVTQAFSFDILKDIQVIAGVGGALYYQREKDKDIFQNFNDEEIKIFAQKIQRILQTV